MIVMRQKKVMPYLVTILAVILLLLGWIGFSAVNRLTETTVLLHEHPFTVSTAILKIHSDLLGMHRSMKDAILADTTEETEKYRKVVDETEGRVLANFKVVENFYLGDSGQVQDARKAFIEWRPIRDEVLHLRMMDRRREAGIMSQTESNRKVEEIEGKITRILEFAEGKAAKFRVQANNTGSQTSLFVMLSCIMALLLSGLIFRKAIQLENEMHALNNQLEDNVQERTQELADANRKLQIQNKEIRFMNDELTAQNEEMKAMNEEIISLNENLAKMNDSLEKRVEERTSELACAHQEVSAQCEELVHMEEELRKLNETLEQQVAERTRQLEFANRELAGFNYSVAHDLRAPIRHIIGFIEILRSESADRLDVPSRDYLQRILDASTKLGQMVDHLLEFSQAGRGEMVQNRVNSNELVQEVLETLKPEMQGRNIEWMVGELPEVTGDKNMLFTVWSNLLGNALKYTRPRKNARIEVGAVTGMDDTEHILFFVKDNGVGFDMKYSDKLFGLFQRLHSKSEFEGNGVGLANVQRIINRHGGKVWAESQLNEGAAFFFTLHIGQQ